YYVDVIIDFSYFSIVNCVDFFFQAEDGIRDRNVTGVQTCALPIYGMGRGPSKTSCTSSNRLQRSWRWLLATEIGTETFLMVTSNISMSPRSLNLQLNLSRHPRQ